MSNPERWEAYQIGAARCLGIDLKRSQYVNDYGNYVAASAADFQAGMLVSLDANQKIVKCTGSNPFGFAKFAKTTGRYATVVGEYVQLNALLATNLAHANLFSGGGTGTVRVGAALTGSAYTEGATEDYVINYTNGTIARSDSGSTISDGGYVYVNYMYAMTAADEQHEGFNFWNKLDDVTIQDSRITVITPPGRIFTSQYDPAVTYTINATLYSGSSATDNLSGFVTTKTTSSAVIGKVFQLPTADDPYLGIEYK